MVEKTVLLVDDSETERALVGQKLERAGYRVVSAADGREGLRRLYDVVPDLVLLDVVMPEVDGWQMLERIRQVSDVPVIMLTGRDAGVERVRGLREGADDYVGKTATPEELLARVDAVLRRSERAPTVRQVYDDDALTIDFESLEVTARGEAVTLTPLEFKLLALLVEHPNQVLSRGQLTELVWDDPLGGSEEQVKVYIGYLRRKLEEDPAKPTLIQTVRGFGYRYCPPTA